MNKTKVCSVCKKRKRITSFYNSKSCLDGHQYSCKECSKNSTRNRANARAEATRRLIKQYPASFREHYYNVLDEMGIE